MRPPPGPTGWMIGVLVELPDEPGPVRHFFAVGQEDRARAEWAAVDQAMLVGPIATSPYKGEEPVKAMRQLTGKAVAGLALRPGVVVPLGRIWPRRWIGSP